MNNWALIIKPVSLLFIDFFTGEKFMGIATDKRGIPRIVFLILNKNICCGYSLQACHPGASNAYPQHLFFSRNKKTINIFPLKKKCLLWSYGWGMFLLYWCEWKPLTLSNDVSISSSAWLSSCLIILSVISSSCFPISLNSSSAEIYIFPQSMKLYLPWVWCI